VNRVMVDAVGGGAWGRHWWCDEIARLLLRSQTHLLTTSSLLLRQTALCYSAWYCLL